MFLDEAPGEGSSASRAGSPSRSWSLPGGRRPGPRASRHLACLGPLLLCAALAPGCGAPSRPDPERAGSGGGERGPGADPRARVGQSSGAGGEETELGPGEGGEPEALPDFDQIWSAVLGEEIWAPPALDGSTVYAGSDAGELVALHRSSGRVRWRLSLGHALRRRPLLVNGAVLAVDERGVIHAVSVDSGRELWRLEGGFVTAPTGLGDSEEGGSRSRTAVLGDARGRLVALEVATGKRAWRRRVAPDARLSEPVAGLGRIFVPDSAGRLHALEAADGKLLWTVEVGADPTAARIEGASLFLVADGFLIALRTADGRELWRTQTSELVGLPPAVAGGRVLVTGGDGRLYAFDTLRGVERWRLRGDGYVRSAPVAAEGCFFVGAGDHHLFALDPSSGRLRWSFETDAFVTGALAVGGGQLLFGSVEGRLHALPLELPVPSPDGRSTAEPELRVGPSFFDGMPTLRFERELAGEGGEAVGWARPGVHGEGGEARVYLGTSAGLLALDAGTGRPAWRRAGAAVDAAPAADPAHRRLVFGDRDGRLRAVDLSDGAIAWEVHAAGAVLGGPLVAGGRVFFGATDGGLYAVRAADGAALWKARAEGRVGAPALDRDLVIAPSCGGRVLALEAATGRELWRRPQGPCVVSVWAGRGSIFAVDARGEMISLEPAVGGERWNRSLGAGVAHGLEVAGGTIYSTTADGHVVAVATASGAESWRWPIGPRASSAPAVDDGIVYAGSHDGHLYAINAINGDELWRLSLASPVIAVGVHVVAGEHRLYATTLDGRLVAVDLP